MFLWRSSLNEISLKGAGWGHVIRSLHARFPASFSKWFEFQSFPVVISRLTSASSSDSLLNEASGCSESEKLHHLSLQLPAALSESVIIYILSSKNTIFKTFLKVKTEKQILQNQFYTSGHLKVTSGWTHISSGKVCVWPNLLSQQRRYYGSRIADCT